MLHDDDLLQLELQEVEVSFIRNTKQLRTGRPRTELFEDISVEVYGGRSSLKSLANINLEPPLSVVISPFDKSITKDIVKSIMAFNPDLNPKEETAKIRINFPPLTGETRKQIVLELYKLAEEAKIRVRRVRKDFIDQVDELEAVSEDEQKRSKDIIQKEIDSMNIKIDQLAKAKEVEILTV